MGRTNDHLEIEKIGNAILAALPDAATPAAAMERMQAVLDATKEDYAEFRLKLLIHAGLFVDDSLVTNPSLDKDSLMRVVANELLTVAAWMVRSLKRQAGEEIDPARFAIVAYTMAEQALQAKWGPTGAAATLHTGKPGELRAEIESFMLEMEKVGT